MKTIDLINYLINDSSFNDELLINGKTVEVKHSRALLDSEFLTDLIEKGLDFNVCGDKFSFKRID